jgi:hypothetical protein
MGSRETARLSGIPTLPVRPDIGADRRIGANVGRFGYSEAVSAQSIPAAAGLPGVLRKRLVERPDTHAVLASDTSAHVEVGNQESDRVGGTPGSVPERLQRPPVHVASAIVVARGSPVLTDVLNGDHREHGRGIHADATGSLAAPKARRSAARRATPERPSVDGRLLTMSLAGARIAALISIGTGGPQVQPVRRGRRG